jgi:hypothetical protein
MSTDALVTPATKSLAAFARKYDHPNVGIFATVIHGIDHFAYGNGCKCVMYLRTIDADARNTFKFMKEYIVVCLNWLPGKASAHNCL